MKRLTVLIIGLILCATFVLAGYATVESLEGGYKVTYSQTIRKGWNLLPADYMDWVITEGKAEFLQKVKASYLYLPVQNKYVNLLSGSNNQDFNLIQSNQQYLKSTAAWYYATTDGMVLSYTVDDDTMPKLYRGWNLLSVAPALSELNEAIKVNHKFPIGNCEIQKAYFWDSYEQVWESIGEPDSLHDSLDKFSDDDAIGVGVAIRVKDTCQMGVASEAISAPPELPQ